MTKLEELIKKIEAEKATGVNPAICEAIIFLLRKQMPGLALAEIKTVICVNCDGTGKHPMTTIAIALPPKERHELDQAANNYPVKCKRCDGAGIVKYLE